jgi:hypothetical protein
MIGTVDRLLAVSSSMAGALYVMAALTLWFMIVFQRSNMSGVVYDRAAAWSALAVIFILLAMVRLGRLQWHDVSAGITVCAAVITVAGLYSVYTLTEDRLGKVPLYAFTLVVLVSGLTVWIWG